MTCPPCSDCVWGSFTTMESDQCGEEPGSTIVIVREDIDDAMGEDPNSGELEYDAGEPTDEPPLGDIVWRRDVSASWDG